MPSSPAPSPDFTTLNQYYSWKDVLALYGGDEDRFLDAYCTGPLPLEVRRVCEETLSHETLQVWLLRRIVRLLNSSDPA